MSYMFRDYIFLNLTVSDSLFLNVHESFSNQFNLWRFKLNVYYTNNN
jgi:hypothetical protein